MDKEQVEKKEPQNNEAQSNSVDIKELGKEIRQILSGITSEGIMAESISAPKITTQE